MAQSRVLRVGLCGAGVVGGGVLSILERMLPAITARHAVELQVTKVLVRDPTKEREGFRLPDGARYVTDWKDVIQDVDMV